MNSMDSNYIDINIKNPLYGDFVYVRDKFIKQAQQERKLLRITTPNGTGLVTPKQWLKDAKKMEKEFKIPGVPMILWGNYVPIRRVCSNCESTFTGNICKVCGLEVK